MRKGQRGSKDAEETHISKKNWEVSATWGYPRMGKGEKGGHGEGGNSGKRGLGPGPTEEKGGLSTNKGNETK